MNEWLIYASTVGSAIAFLIGLFQWLDVRKREEKRLRYEQFQRAFERLAGRTAHGQILVNTQQALSAYELSRFPEYSDLSLPIIRYYLNQTTSEPDTSLFREALLYSESLLSTDTSSQL